MQHLVQVSSETSLNKFPYTARLMQLHAGSVCNTALLQLAFCMIGLDLLSCTFKPKTMHCCPFGAGPPPDSAQLICCACSHEWCSQCKLAWHPTTSCQAEQALLAEAQRQAEISEQQFTEFLAQRRHVSCPQCGIKIQKTKKGEDGAHYEACNKMR